MRVIKYVFLILCLSILACQQTPKGQGQPIAEWPPKEGQYSLLVEKLFASSSINL